MILDKNPLASAAALGALCLLSAPLGAQTVEIDTFWQRSSGCKVFDHLRPFRKPAGLEIHERGQLVDLVNDLVYMLGLRLKAKPKELSFDSEGREIFANKKWAEAFARVQRTSLTMEGWLGHILLHSEVISQRQAACYGMFYFNNPQNVIHMVSFVPGEPIRELRQETMQRAINYMAVHYGKSRPMNPARPKDGLQVPAYDFNPLPYMELLETKSPVDQAQGLWFLGEVLRIRPDMGKAWFDEMRGRIRPLLQSRSKVVRMRLGNFLSAIRTEASKQAELAPNTDDTGRLTALFEAIDKELFPPIRHISTGLCELYPSAELRALAKKGRAIMKSDSILPPGSAKAGSLLRYGLRVAKVPSPLEKLGIPRGAVIVNVNQVEVRSAALLRKRITEVMTFWRKQMDAHEVHLAEFRRDNKDPNKKPRPAPVLSFQVEYVHKGKALLREFRYMQ